MTRAALLRTSAIAVAVCLPLAVTPVAAQQNQQQAQQGQQQQNQQQQAQGQQQGQQQNALVATVGDAEIRTSDIQQAIGTLPPQLQQQPPQMLIPIALDQLVLRELILQEAKAQGLQDDQEVVALVEQESGIAEDRALVQVWLTREMEERVTDQKVEQIYTDLKAANPNQQLPPLEQVRQQIEAQASQEAMGEIRGELMQGADIVLYDASGNPVEQQQQQ